MLSVKTSKTANTANMNLDPNDDNNTLIMERPSITVPGKIVKWVDIFHKQNKDYPSEIQEYSKIQAAAERLHYENEDILDFDMLIYAGQYGRHKMEMKMWEYARKFPETSQNLADEEQTKVILATQIEDWENENRSLVTEKEDKILEWQRELKERIAVENIEVDQRIRVNKWKIAKTIVYEKKAIDIKTQRLKYANDFIVRFGLAADYFVHAPKENKFLVKENILLENMRDCKDRISTEEVRQLLSISTFQELIALPHDQCLKRLRILNNLGYWKRELQPSMISPWMESQKILCQVAGFFSIPQSSVVTKFLILDRKEIYTLATDGDLIKVLRERRRLSGDLTIISEEAVILSPNSVEVTAQQQALHNSVIEQARTQVYSTRSTGSLLD